MYLQKKYRMIFQLASHVRFSGGSLDFFLERLPARPVGIVARLGPTVWWGDNQAVDVVVSRKKYPIISSGFIHPRWVFLGVFFRSTLYFGSPFKVSFVWYFSFGCNVCPIVKFHEIDTFVLFGVLAFSSFLSFSSLGGLFWCVSFIVCISGHCFYTFSCF